MGIDKIPLTFLKIILPGILHHLTHIFNYCITSCVFPDAWKRALVIPIPKTNVPFNPKDFRPISILPVLSKAFELILQKQIQEYINTKKLLDTFQSGFRKHHSTTTALTKVSYDILHAFNNSKFVILVLLDFSKAFDSVNHILFLQKLKFFYKFSDLSVQLIHSYLNTRSQLVKYGDDESSLLPISAGVAQGSILGAMFFAMFINDLVKSVRFSSYHAYADDFQLYLSGNLGNISEITDMLNDDLNRISLWSTSNGLNINPTKSQAIFLYKRPIDVDIPNILLNSVPIEFTNKAKNLGVIFNSTLGWNDHVCSISKKVHFALHSLRQMNLYTPPDIKILLVRSLLIPFFTYCAPLFYNADFESKRKLNVAFNSCIRYVFNLRKYDHVSPYVNSILGAPLSVYLEFHICCFVHSLILRKTPNYLASLITFGSSRRIMNISSLSDRFSSRQFCSSLFVHGFNIWNSLPTELKRCRSLHSFKASCKTHLFSKFSYTEPDLTA